MASSVTVRPAARDDLPHIGRLGALLVEEHHRLDARRFLAPGPRTPEGYATFLGTQIDNPDAAVLVADDDGTVIGYTFAVADGYDYMALRGPAGVVHDVVVDSSSRGRGVGRLLLDAAIAFLKGRGAPRVLLMTAERNEVAQRLFSRAGFHRTMIEMTLELEP